MGTPTLRYIVYIQTPTPAARQPQVNIERLSPPLTCPNVATRAVKRPAILCDSCQPAHSRPGTLGCSTLGRISTTIPSSTSDSAFDRLHSTCLFVRLYPLP